MDAQPGNAGPVTVYFIFSEDEISLLVIVLDVNPIWWGQQAQRDPEVELSSLIILKKKITVVCYFF